MVQVGDQHFRDCNQSRSRGGFCCLSWSAGGAPLARAGQPVRGGAGFDDFAGECQLVDGGRIGVGIPASGFRRSVAPVRWLDDPLPRPRI